MKTNEFQSIKDALTQACISGNPKLFIPYLLTKNVNTGMNSKVRFYSFFKNLIICSEKNSLGRLYLKIEKPIWEKDKTVNYYNFYDDQHKYSRISILVKEVDNKLFLDALPF